MGFWKEVKDFGKTISDGINSFVGDIQRKNIRWNKYKKLKLRIIGNASLSELKKICREYGVKEPQLYITNPLDGKRESLGNPRNLFLNQIIRKVSLDNLIDYARNKRISVNDIVNEKRKADEEFERGSSTKSEKNFESEMGKEEESEDEFELVLKSLEGFNPENVRDEKDLENMLKTWLRARLDGYDIGVQYKTEKGNLDIIINKKYGIELKLIERKKELENLFGQIHKYLKELGKNNLAVILLISKYISQKDVSEWTKEYENLGARVYILEKGKIKRKSPTVKKAVISWRR